MTQSIELLGQEFIMHPSGALFWVETGDLLISDLHLGKIAHFRKHGAAVPQQAAKINFEKLNGVKKYFNPKKIIFLGDLFHSYINRDWVFFEAWVKQNGCKLELITGNHDIISPLRFEKLDIPCKPSVEQLGFSLTHHPSETETAFNIAGHIHPAVRLAGPGRQNLRLPCFYLRPRQLILPAFGTFTGTHTIQPDKADQVFVVTPEEVISVGRLAY